MNHLKTMAMLGFNCPIVESKEDDIEGGMGKPFPRA